jgi:ELP3 family radical SAM enzyme/protein acetyltransferase
MQDIENIINEPPRNLNSAEILEKYIDKILENKIKNKVELNILIKELNKEYNISCSCLELLYIYRKLCKEGKYKYDDHYKQLLQTKSYRSRSGVLVVAIFTSPFPETKDKYGKIKKQEFSCEYNCHFCPNEPNQPRSYLLNEPGVQRANKNNFDPELQFKDRINQYINMGHPIDKIELIILGGTWSSYPKDYQENFIRDIIYSANTLYSTVSREKLSIKEEQKINETTDCKIIGITIETRPDKINLFELKFLRKLGVTRVQLGIQHINDRILYRINRKCNSNQAIKAIKMLKDCCFKIDIHLMPDLPQPFLEGVDNLDENITIDDIDINYNMYTADKIMFDTVINSPDWQVDQWKIYPCEVVPWTRIEKDYKNGLYKPYGDQKNKNDWTDLSELLIYVLSNVKPWIRLNRIVRDIPNEYIIGGNQNVSLRQDLDSELKKRNIYCMDIRNREVKDKNINPKEAILKVRKYEASEGDEYFISFETKDEKILFGFLRLRLSKNAGYEYVRDGYIFDELKDCALIRELHVYGKLKKVNDKNINMNNNIQHIGLGKRLINEAIKISIKNNYNKIAVISGIGVTSYYKEIGFKENKYYLIKNIKNIKNNKLYYNLINILIIFLGILFFYIMY